MTEKRTLMSLLFKINLNISYNKNINKNLLKVKSLLLNEIKSSLFDPLPPHLLLFLLLIILNSQLKPINKILLNISSHKLNCILNTPSLNIPL
jgi:hypothetical protein